MIEITKQDRMDDAAREDDEMLIRRFVAAVGYDYIQHHKKHTAQIHPDFSEETLVFWDEIKSRLKGTVVLDFDREGVLAELRENGKEQAKLCQTADFTSSYHFGLKQAYYDAMRIIENHTKKGNSHDD
jgi:hypothetical protein